MITNSPPKLLENLTFVRPEEPIWPVIVYSVIFSIISLAVLIWLYIILRRKYLKWKEFKRPGREAVKVLDTGYKNLKQDGYTKFAFIVVSVIKTYLTDKFDCDAKTQTFSEFEKAVHEIELLNEDEHNTIIQLLKHCDAICFAAEGVDAADLTIIYETAHSFILNTRDIKGLLINSP